MAMANYTNDRRGNLPKILGQFKEIDCGHWFEYADRGNDGIPICRDCFPHKVFVGGFDHKETRFAKVLKSVVHIVIDENADGRPVVEKWRIRNHSEYA